MPDDFTINIDTPSDPTSAQPATYTLEFPTDHTIECPDDFGNELETLQRIIAAYQLYKSNNPDTDPLADIPLTATDEKILNAIPSLYTSPDKNAEYIQTLLDANPHCLDYNYYPTAREICARITSTTATEFLMLSPELLGVSLHSAGVDYTPQHDLHIVATWDLYRYSPAYLDAPNFNTDKYIDNAREPELPTDQIPTLLHLRNEHQQNPNEVVPDNNLIGYGARIAGTTNTALHIAYQIRELDYTLDDFGRWLGDGLTTEQIDSALKYAHEHPKEYKKYLEEKDNQKQQNNLTLTESSRDPHVTDYPGTDTNHDYTP